MSIQSLRSVNSEETKSENLKAKGQFEVASPAWLIVVAGLLLASASLIAQQSTSSDPLPPRGPQTTADLSISVRRVVVDVVVTDSKGKIVAGLKNEDFRALENGAPQQIRSFDQHDSKVVEPVPPPQLPPNTFSNFSTTQGGPITVILYDLLNTPLDHQAYAHEQLLSFLKNRKASGQMAIFVLSDKLHMLQGFTDDENQLIAALDRQKGRYKSPNMQTSAEENAGSDQLTRTAGNQNGADDPSSANPSFKAVTAMLQHMETMEASYNQDQRVAITVDALEGIARFVIGLPGRKNLVWMSSSFPTAIVPDEAVGGRDSFEITRNYSATVVQATDLLNLSHVAVYPVDVSGLQVNPMFSGGNSQTYEPGSRRDGKALHDFSQQTEAAHTTMDIIADQTGGHAFYNTNGLKEAVSTAVQQGSSYYTLTYSPTDKTMDGKIRKIRLELLQPGYQMSYRRSYFADKLDDKLAAAEEAPSNPLEVSLGRGEPPAHELFFEAHIQTLGTPTRATPAEMGVLAQYEAAAGGNKKRVAATKDPVTMQRYVISYGLLLRQLALQSNPDGTRHGTLEFAVVSYNDDGRMLNGLRTKVNDVIQPDRYARLQNSGYQLLQTIDVPVQATSLRIAVRDLGTNHLGSLELHLPLPAEAKVQVPERESR